MVMRYGKCAIKAARSSPGMWSLVARTSYEVGLSLTGILHSTDPNRDLDIVRERKTGSQRILLEVLFKETLPSSVPAQSEVRRPTVHSHLISSPLYIAKRS